MNKRLAKRHIYIMLMLISMMFALCTGCSSSYEDATVNATAKSEDVHAQVTTSASDKKNDDMQYDGTLYNVSRRTSTPLYYYEMRNGRLKKSPLVSSYMYNGEPILLYERSTAILDDIVDEVPGYMIVLSNYKLCLSTYNDNKDYIHEITMKVGQTEEYNHLIEPSLLYKDKDNRVDIICLPLGKYSDQEAYAGVATLASSFEVASSIDINESSPEMATDIIIDSCENVYGKTYNELCEFKDNVISRGKQDWIFDNNGVPTYSHNPCREYKDEKCHYYTLLICDGKLYNGFDGKSILYWESDGNDIVHHPIDTSLLEKGKHKLSVINIELREENKIIKDFYSKHIEIEVE